MTEATCRRELELEIPAMDVQKAVERVAREFARVARVPATVVFYTHVTRAGLQSNWRLGPTELSISRPDDL